MANNLQFVASFLWLRRKSLPAGSAGADALDAARARLDMMSRVHRRLHDPSSVDQPIGDYLRALCMDLIQTSDTPGVRLVVQADPVTLNLEALMSVSLIVAELVTNSLKHAFQGREDGEIRIGVSLDEGHYAVTVADDGPGIPENVVTSEERAIGTGHSRQPGPPVAGADLLRARAPGAVVNCSSPPSAQQYLRAGRGSGTFPHAPQSKSKGPPWVPAGADARIGPCKRRIWKMS